MQSQQNIELRQNYESVLFFSHCGTWGVFISTLPHPLASICVKLIGQEKGRKAGTKYCWII